MKSSLLVLLSVFALVMMAMTVAATGPYTSAALADEIIDLPDAPKYTRQFSGYLPVFNNSTKMFYWFVQAEQNPATAPVLFWTSGGPGCSGLIGKLTEMGPYAPRAKQGGGAKLELRETTWNKYYNIFYVEQPDVGFTNIDPGFAPRVWTDTEIAERNADAIEQFFIKFPQFKSNSFGISSESYGGHYIPTLARELISRINAGRSTVNFKLSIVGNPLVYLPARDFGAYATLIERQIIPRFPLGETYMSKCRPELQKFPNPPAPRPAICDSLESQMDTYTSRVDPYAMSFPVCVDTKGNLKSSGGDYHEYIMETFGRVQKSYKSHTLLETKSIHETMTQSALLKAKNSGEELFGDLMNQITGNNDGYFPADYQPCEDDWTTMYLNRPDVQKALHANLVRPAWRMCNRINYDDYQFIDNMLPVYQDNAKKGPSVRQLIFSGTDDSVCSPVEVQMTIFPNWTTKVFWKEVNVRGQLAGYKSTFTSPENLTFVTVHGAGHMAPSTKPAYTLEILKRFIDGTL